MALLASFAKKEHFAWPTFWVILGMHLLAPLAFFTFTWQGLAAFVILYLLTGSIGISFCYHRMLTHNAFRAKPWVKYLSTFIACLALEGGPIFWTATHRYHHKESDQPMDTHSPRESVLWAHVLWLFYDHPDLATQEARGKFVPDLYADPVIRWFETYNAPIAFLFGLALFSLGTAVWNLEVGISMLTWGFFLRVVATWHITWSINSLTHVLGYQNYTVKDTSTNLWPCAWLGFGEGWHNNHHAHQKSANFGHRWWEFDSTYSLVVWPCEKLGLLENVSRPKLDAPPPPPSRGKSAPVKPVPAASGV